MTTRRSFLSSLVKNAAGLYLAPDALEMLAEPRRKLWRGASFDSSAPVVSIADLQTLVHEVFAEQVIPWLRYQSPTVALLKGMGTAEYRPTGQRLIFPARLA